MDTLERSSRQLAVDRQDLYQVTPGIRRTLPGNPQPIAHMPQSREMSAVTSMLPPPLAVAHSVLEWCEKDIAIWFTPHTSHLTPHVTRSPHFSHLTSHVTRHTSHVTRHTPHVTSHLTSHTSRHTSHVTRHTSHVTRHTSHVTRHTSHVTLHACHRCAALDVIVVSKLPS
jgi:hypothetical protein